MVADAGRAPDSTDRDATMDDIAEFTSRIGAGAIDDAQRLGDIVFWTVAAVDTPKLSTLAAALGAHGFEEHPRVRKSVSTAFHQALRIANATMRKRGEHIEARKPKRGAMRAAMVRIAPAPDGRTMDVGNVGHIDVEADGRIRASSDIAPEAARAFSDAFAFARSHAVADDVRVIVRDIVTGAARGFAVRASGGVYFVHRDNDARIDALRALLDDVAPNATITRIAQLNDAAARDAFASSAQDALQSRLDAFRSETSAWLARSGAKRDASWTSRIEALRDIEAEASIFEAALSFRAEALRERVAETRSAIESMRDGAAPVALPTRSQAEAEAEADAEADAAMASASATIERSGDDNAADAIGAALAALGIDA